MNTELEIMFKLIQCALKQLDISDSLQAKLEEETVKKILNFASKHEVAHLVARPLLGKQIFSNDTEFQEKLKRSVLLATYQTAKIEAMLQNVTAELAMAKIKHIPLKGSYIRNLYPESWMRTSCDIDILVHPEDLDDAVHVLSEKLQCKSAFKGEHDVSLFSPNNIHIELHFNLIEEHLLPKADLLLSNVWESAYATENEYCLNLEEDMFYFYHIAHMAKHVMHGGCGIRPFVDIWVLKHSNVFNWEKAHCLLESGGLSAFALAVENIACYWFEDENIELSRVEQDLQQFVLGGGVYGSMDNLALVESNHDKSKSQNSSFINKIWKPYDTLVYWYPNLKKHKWLLPYYQFKRWIKILFGGTVKSAIQLKKRSAESDTSKKTSVNQMLDTLGLYSK